MAALVGGTHPSKNSPHRAKPLVASMPLSEHRVAFAAAWSDLGSLRGALLLRRAAAGAPAAAVLAIAALGAWPPTPARVALGLLLALATLGAQRVLHTAASLAVMPSQRATAALAAALAAQRAVPRLAALAAPGARALAAMEARRDAGRRQLLAHAAGAERVVLRAPDGVLLDALVAGGGRGHAARRAWIIYLGGNGEHVENRADLLLYVARGYGVLLLNYRGVGDSGGGVTTRDGAVTDVATGAGGASPRRPQRLQRRQHGVARVHVRFGDHR